MYVTSGVRVRLYAQAREAVGHRELRRPLDADGATLGALLEALIEEYPALRPVLPGCRFALNGAYVPHRAVRLRAGDDVGIHPPYSGG